MCVVEVFLIAVSLALDAFAVSVSSGIAIPGFGWKQAVKMGVWFGAFQFAMPLAGWLLGSSVSGYIQAVDHWVAFGLLALIGGKMVWGALGRGAGEEDEAPADLSPRRLCLLAIATSIDALAVGVSMAFMKVDVWFSALVIGVVAFVLSVVGGLAGRRLGALFQRRAELVGGLVLIGIGVKILVEHTLGG
ncbi:MULTISPECIES: manganese efflux pump MntP family protein [Oscillospiraceae]|uniref:manganese efflux pump MntP n=1 Tax=Oscillospiraceae TaxID=216572 RepID=UPI000B3A0E87|nr:MULTISPECIES: manganese efflux pump MntP family protein [Oscillospiraceae]MBM6888269.1 manganese efflux pump [Pseudoflavonifractor phocaeensis]OUO44457.1 manganese efflux pump MntP [Flavonifractor sp. An306]